MNFIKYYLAAKTKYQIHSPFVYELLSEVLEDDRHFYAFDDMDTFYTWIGQFKKEINWQNSKKAAKLIFKELKVNPSIGQFFFRLANYYQYRNIVEIGNGLNGLWLAQAVPNAQFLVIETATDWADVLKNYCDNQSWNFEIQTAERWNPKINISVKMPQIDVLIFDGIATNNDIQATFEEILPYLTEDSLVIINNKNVLNPTIWQQLRTHSRVRLSLDLFHLGLIYLKHDQAKSEHLQVIDRSWKPWSR